MIRALKRPVGSGARLDGKGERRWLGWLLGLFVLTWLGGLIVTAPLRLIQLPASALPAGMRLIPVGGTLWQGQWQLSLPRGEAVSVTTHFLLSSLLRFSPSWQIAAHGTGLNAQAVVAPGWHDIRVSQGQAQLPADSGLLQYVTPWPLGGQLQGTGSGQFVQSAEGWKPSTAALTLDWQNARVTTTEPLALGHLSLTVKVAADQVSGTLAPLPAAKAPLKGRLMLSGHVMSALPLRIHGFLETTAYASDALRQQVGLLGHPGPDGRIPIDGHLPGR